MSETAERLCLRCAKQIPKWRSKAEKFCNGVCRIQFREEEKKRKAAERAFKAKDAGLVRVHSCLANQLDPYKSCDCRLMVSEEKAKILVSRGEAVDFSSRAAIFTSGSILIIGKVKRTPRVATLERSHIERANTDYDTTLLKGKTQEELTKLAEMSGLQDRVERAAEEKVRIEVYGELARDFIRRLTREIPAEKYDLMAKRDPWRGRAILVSFNDERSSMGSDSPGSPRDRELEYEPSESQEKHPDDVIERDEHENESLDDIVSQEEPEKAVVGSED